MNDFLIHRSALAPDHPLSKEKISWSSPLGCWITADLEIVERILRSLDFYAVDYRRELARIGGKIGYQFDHSTYALSSIPLALENKDHKEARHRIAERLAKLSENAIVQFAKCVEDLMFLFRNNHEFDVAKDFFFPISATLLNGLTSSVIAEDKELLSCSQIFDRSLSLSRRKRINELLGVSRKGGASDQTGVDLALQILGGDAIPGSLQESFIAHIQLRQGVRLDRIEWGDSYISSGVPYVERVAKKNFELAQQIIGAGDRVRVYLDTKNFAENRQGNFFFGAGRHTCLGKQISLRAWRILADKLCLVSKRVELLEVKYRKSDFVFNCPVSVSVRTYD